MRERYARERYARVRVCVCKSERERNEEIY